MTNQLPIVFRTFFELLVEIQSGIRSLRLWNAYVKSQRSFETALYWQVPRYLTGSHIKTRSASGITADWLYRVGQL
ncbi:MAG: hypothetical protein U9N46_11300 [Euryarchaeota archaeon]|nr:hypothetical protein [Euryarchaeota archaeon]